jgi:hypothetical protein
VGARVDLLRGLVLDGSLSKLSCFLKGPFLDSRIINLVTAYRKGSGWPISIELADFAGLFQLINGVKRRSPFGAFTNQNSSVI